MKTVGIIVLILVLVGGGYGIYTEIRAQRQDLQALKAADEKAQAIIAEKEARIVALVAENAALTEQDRLSEQEKVRLRADLNAKTIENNKLRADLKTAPPETVLAQTRTWLDTSEVWLRINAASLVEAVFSLAAFRLNADALAERQHLKFTLVPSLQAQITEGERQLATRAAIIGNQQTIIAAKDEIIGQKDSQLGVRDDQVKALKKRNFWRTLAYIAGSFLIGFVIGK